MVPYMLILAMATTVFAGSIPTYYTATYDDIKPTAVPVPYNDLLYTGWTVQKTKPNAGVQAQSPKNVIVSHSVKELASGLKSNYTVKFGVTQNDIAYYYSVYLGCARSKGKLTGTPVPCSVKFKSSDFDNGTFSSDSQVVTCNYTVSAGAGAAPMELCDAAFAMTKGVDVTFPGKQDLPPDTVVYLDDLYYLTAGDSG